MCHQWFKVSIESTIKKNYFLLIRNFFRDIWSRNYCVIRKYRKTLKNFCLFFLLVNFSSHTSLNPLHISRILESISNSSDNIPLFSLPSHIDYGWLNAEKLKKTHTQWWFIQQMFVYSFPKGTFNMNEFFFHSDTQKVTHCFRDYFCLFFFVRLSPSSI